MIPYYPDKGVRPATTDTLRSLHQPEQCAPAWALLATCGDVFEQDNPMGRGMSERDALQRCRAQLGIIRREWRLCKQQMEGDTKGAAES